MSKIKTGDLVYVSPQACNFDFVGSSIRSSLLRRLHEAKTPGLVIKAEDGFSATVLFKDRRYILFRHQLTTPGTKKRRKVKKVLDQRKEILYL